MHGGDGAPPARRVRRRRGGMPLAENFDGARRPGGHRSGDAPEENPLDCPQAARADEDAVCFPALRLVDQRVGGMAVDHHRRHFKPSGRSGAAARSSSRLAAECSSSKSAACSKRPSRVSSMTVTRCTCARGCHVRDATAATAAAAPGDPSTPTGTRCGESGARPPQRVPCAVVRAAPPLGAALSRPRMGWGGDPRPPTLRRPQSRAGRPAAGRRRGSERRSRSRSQ